MKRPTPIGPPALTALAALCGVAMSAGSPVAGEPTPEEHQLVERSRARARTVRLRIEPRRGVAPGTCAGLGADELRVVVRGRPVEDLSSIDLVRDLEPTLHALVIDTSGSMLGHLDYVRRAALGYLDGLRPGDEPAMVMSFDDSAVLWQSVTHDRGKLRRAIEAVRMGGKTSMLDALHDSIVEIEARRERPVILLLTDGVDSSSLHERDDVRRMLGLRADLTIFVIGLALPPISSSGSASTASNRRFLQRLAERTNGAFFDAPTPSRLAGIYERIREMLDSEARLTVVDPDPEPFPDLPMNLKVASSRSGCKVRVYDETAASAGGPSDEPLSPPYPALPQRLPLFPGEVWRPALNPVHHRVDAACGPPEKGLERDVGRLLERYWRAEVSATGISGCALDVVLGTGILYDPMEVARGSVNDWLRLKTRPFEIAVPRLSRLPRHPEEVLDRLAGFALQAAGDDVSRDPRKQPPEHHARPFEDYPSLNHGAMFSKIRPTLARALFHYPDYRAWALGRLEHEADRDLERLEQRLRRRLPDLPPSSIRQAVIASPDGREILERASAPTATDLQRHLAAWLGDITAHELFLRWERLWIDRLIAAAEPDPSSPLPEFRAGWRELRRVLFAPSYARVLTLLYPIHEDEAQPVGFYRILLPRVAWLLPRVQGYRKHPEWSDLPLDLVPDVPLAYVAVERMLHDAPALARRLDRPGTRTSGVTYRLLDPPRRHDPRRAFRHTEVEVGFETQQGPLSLVAELRLDRGGGAPRVTRYGVVDEHGVRVAGSEQEGREGATAAPSRGRSEKGRRSGQK